MQVKKCKVALPFIHVPHIATTSLNRQYLSLFELSVKNEHALHSEDDYKKIFYEKGLKLSSLDKATIWVFVFLSSDVFFTWFAHSRKLRIIGGETHLM